MLVIAKPLYQYGAKINALVALQDVPILVRKREVKLLLRVLHCFLVNNVIERGNLKLGCHIVQYEV